MIFGFKKQFEQKIIEGSKIHTIREDPHDRWKPGRKIHFATGIRTPNYNEFKRGGCISIEFIKILYFEDGPNVYTGDTAESVMPFYIPEHYGLDQMKAFVKNDGFSSVSDFFKWFNKDFIGKIIHWTDFRY